MLCRSVDALSVFSLKGIEFGSRAAPVNHPAVPSHPGKQERSGKFAAYYEEDGG